MSTDDTDGDRIAKVLSRAGVASRRDAERMILDGRVKVNGKVVTSPALNVTARDRLTVDDAPVAAPEPTRLWVYHKPAGVVTTTVDDQGRETVFEGLPEDMPRVMSIGRLDLTSEGLLLLTNDGEVKRRLELPSTGWLRRYRVRINGSVSEAELDRLRAGITVDGVDYAPMEVQFDRQQGANAWLTIGLREGKNREIRRVMDHLGVPVNRLIRVSYGPFQLGELEAGGVKEVARKVVREQLGAGDAGEEQRLTRRTRGARPTKVKPIRTGPVMRTTKGGPRPGEASVKPSAARMAVEGTAGEKPRRVKPARAGFTSERPGRSPAKAEAIAAARAPRSAGFKSHRSDDRPEGDAPRRDDKPRSAGFKSHRPDDRAAGDAQRTDGKPRSAGKTSHAAREDAGAARKGPFKPRGPVMGGGARDGQAPRGAKPTGAYAPRGPRVEGDRPRGPKPEGGYAGRGPKAEGGFASRGPKPEGGFKGRGPRVESDRSRGPKPEGGYAARGPKPEGGYGARGPKPDGGFKARGPKLDGGSAPRGPKPAGEGAAPRAAGGEGDAPRKARHKSGAAGFKPQGAPSGADGGGDPAGPRGGAPRGGKKRPG